MISDVFIKRPVTSIVISIVIVLVGVLAMMNLPVTQYPDISPPTVSVTANYTGADAQTVEQTLATPVETQINGTPGMAYITSTNTSTGQLNMTVTFEVGTDIDIATLDVQNRASIAEPSLPEEVRRLGVTVRKRNPSIMMVIGIYSPDRTHDVQYLDNYTNIYVKDALMRVEGVGDITSIGQDFSMRLWLQPDKLAQYNIGASEIMAAIQEQNVQVAAGTVGAAPQYDNQAFQYPITVTGRLQTQDEFGDIIVRTNPADGSVVYLRDVARIEFGQFDYGRSATINGNPATMMLIYQAPGSNALETAEGIYAALDELKKSFPADVDYIVSFETVSVVQVSINEVVHTLIEALILVIIVVFLFLQSWRATLVPILAIPVSIIGTFIFFIPLGFTINTLTLFGFVLSIGIVVDDAIVVVEAVQHYIDHERISAREATRKAMKDITAPVIAIALILAAVFIPVGFIPGIVGRLYQQFAITIAISVLISAFVALTLTPALCSLMLKPMNVNPDSRGINKFFYKFNNWFARVTESYSVGVRKSIKATPLVLIILVCIYVGTAGMFVTKPSGFIPTEDEGRLFVSVELPEGSSKSRTEAILAEMGEIMATVPAVKNYTAISGLNAINFSFKSNSGTYFLQLKPWDERESEADQLAGVMATLQQRFAALKEANVLVVAPPAIPGLGQSGGFSFVLQQRQAGDVKELERVMGQFLGAANARPEIAMAYSFFNARTPGYHVEVDREKAKRLGVNIADIYSTMATYMGSRYVNDFTRYGRNFRVVAQADTSYRMDIGDLRQYYVMNRQGESVPLSALVTTEVEERAAVISHYNLFRSVDINGSAAPGYSSGQALQALEEVAAEVLPAGYGYEFTGLSREELAAGSSTIYIFSLSIILVLLLLAALYESWSVPFSILFAIPLGMFGAILALTLLPKLDNNVYAQVGMITLIGLAAKNAILIVEFAKERVDRGMELLEATIEAVKLRLRPIIMTSLAFILGVVPLALASGAGAVSRQTIGWVVIGGMLAATFLAIFVVPVLYVVITRLAYGKKGLAELRAQANNRPEDGGGSPEYVNP
ncbi:efflux RND transporter permease subunit [Pontibacter actiniarum]|uniref:Multidrug efflux RND transporter permease subunit n=1 Tax=Pontibacter actiniarum TaxID=323450 RepID=A0A1X9YP09_9BACT|nr:multidrug efflux RND transporter permease subunit [Pontibacter actiniarum]ARS34613.1 multidrug efflux RND transporter permease subunit [Pontibacter actiniarum]